VIEARGGLLPSPPCVAGLPGHRAPLGAGRRAPRATPPSVSPRAPRTGRRRCARARSWPPAATRPRRCCATSAAACWRSAGRRPRASPGRASRAGRRCSPNQAASAAGRRFSRCSFPQATLRRSTLVLWPSA
jgi:hypothetical protein